MSSTALPPPQLTPRAIVLAIVLAMVLAAANTYLGLFAGLTIASAIPAAVVSMAVLRLLGGGTILENNIVQTGASAGSSIASGVIFTVPGARHPRALDRFPLRVGARDRGPRRHPRRVLLGAAAPLADRRAEPQVPRRRGGGRGAQGGREPGARASSCWVLSALGGGLTKLAAGSGLRVIPDTAAASGFIGKWLAYFGTNLSPALLGVGYIVGLNIGALALIGGMISWSVAIPIYAAHFLADNAALAQQLAGADARDRSPYANLVGAGPLPRRRRDADRRHLGADLDPQFARLGHQQRPRRDAQGRGARSSSHTEQDLPMKAILIGLVLFTCRCSFSTR